MSRYAVEMKRLPKLALTGPLLLAFSVTLSACGNNSTDTTTSVPIEQTQSAEEPLESDDHEWYEDGSSQQPQSDGSRSVPTDFRVATQEGYDRVVVEFTGTSLPGWDAKWVDAPVDQGAGGPLDVSGTAFLDIAITGTNWPSDPGEPEIYYPGEGIKAAGNISAAFDGTYEDTTHVVIGMDGKHAYQIFTLEDPTRIVIDVKN